MAKCVNMLVPQPNDLPKQRWISSYRNEQLFPWRKAISSMPAWQDFFFPPLKGLPDLWRQESCMDHSQLWKPSHPGAWSHAPAALPPLPRYQACFFQGNFYTASEWRSILVHQFHSSATASCSIIICLHKQYSSDFSEALPYSTSNIR